MKSVPAARLGLHEAKGLVTTAQAQHQVERGLLLDVVVGQRAAVLQLLAREDEPLLVGRNPCGSGTPNCQTTLNSPVKGACCPRKSTAS